MNIQWYPGHMARAGREIKEDVSAVDAVVEIVDARIPVSSRNPSLDGILRNKPRVIALNRADLSELSETEKWILKFNSQGIPAFACDSKSGAGIGAFFSAVKKALSEKLEIRARRGAGAMPIKVMVVGIPNVGKSSFINRAAGRSPARVEDRPGVTRQNSWFKLKGGFELLDTPGLLQPKLSPRQAGEHLAFCGALRDEILDIEGLAAALMYELLANKPEMVEKYRAQGEDPEKTGYMMLENFSFSRKFVIRGNAADTGRGAVAFLGEFRSGKMGRITLEPVDFKYRWDAGE
jgi:ribosome biogenesis GTPase A